MAVVTSRQMVAVADYLGELAAVAEGDDARRFADAREVIEDRAGALAMYELPRAGGHHRFCESFGCQHPGIAYVADASCSHPEHNGHLYCAGHVGDAAFKLAQLRHVVNITPRR